MKRISDYKNEAIDALNGNWGMAALVTIVFIIILQIPSFPSLLGENVLTDSSLGIIAILLLPLIYGFYVIFLSLIRSKELKFSFLFDGFKDYVRILLTLLLTYVYVILWSILFLIPGIVKSYSYSMVFYILKDNPELSNNAAIEKSMQMMKGNKWRLFLLDLSFIGWGILSLMTLGIGFLFLQPYMLTARAAFYEDLKPKSAHSVEIVEEA